MKRTCSPCLLYCRPTVITPSRTVKKALILGKIAVAMKEQLMTRSELAARMHTAGPQITKLLTMGSNPTLNTLFELEEIIGINIIDLQP